MFFSSDEEKYTYEWENSDELQFSISLEEYIYKRKVQDYGLNDDEIDFDE